MIYYRNKKLRNLFIRNNTNKPTAKFNVVYQYTCDKEPCNSTQLSYIGHTTTTIKDRFKQHSSIKKHHRDAHNTNITGSQMTPNVRIIATNHTRQDLIILEALLIKQNKPIINIQTGDFNRILKIFK